MHLKLNQVFTERHSYQRPSKINIGTRGNDPITKTIIRSSVYEIGLEGVFYNFIFNVTIWLTKSSIKLNFNIQQTQNAMEISSFIWIINDEYIWVIEISSYIIEKSKKNQRYLRHPFMCQTFDFKAVKGENWAKKRQADILRPTLTDLFSLVMNIQKIFISI
jgi:hypothetical protein